MTTITAQKVKLVNRGTWSSTATYTEGDIVQYNGVSYVYKNPTSKSFTALFHGPISGLPLTGTISSLAAQTNTFTVTWGSALPSVNDSRLNELLDVYMLHIDPDNKIVSYTNNSTTSTTFVVSKRTSNTTTQTSVSIVIGTRRLGGRYEVALNTIDWDMLSETLTFAGEWSAATNYIPGQIVTKNNNSYICVSGHINVDPLFDFLSAWEPYLIGDDAYPHERVATPVNANPFGWDGHPFLNKPTWGTANTYSGIPWNLPSSHRTNYFSSIWNTPHSRCHDVRFGSFFTVDANGSQLGNGDANQMGVAGGWGLDGYRHYVGEGTAHFNNEWLSDQVKGRGNISWKDSKTTPKFIQYYRAHYAQIGLTSSGSLMVGGNFIGAFGESSLQTEFIDLGRTRFGNRSLVKFAVGAHNSPAGGFTHILALDEYGEIWAMGANSYGQCGIGTDSSTATDITLRYQNSDQVYTPVRLQKNLFFGGARIVDVFAGTNCSYALDENGALWSWGENTYGQLGYATSTFPLNTDRSQIPRQINVNWATFGGIQKVFVAATESRDALFVLDGQGHIWNCGWNITGLLGRNNATNDTNASTITRTSSTASWTIGGNIRNMWVNTNGGTQGNSFFLDNSNQLWACGYGLGRIFGNTPTTARLVPAQVFSGNGALTNIVSISGSGKNNTTNYLLLDVDGWVFTGGLNAYGQSGLGGTLVAGQNTMPNQPFGASTTTTGFLRVPLPSSLQKTIVDVWSQGNFDAGTTESQAHYMLTNRGEILAAGRDIRHWNATLGNVMTFSPKEHLL